MFRGEAVRAQKLGGAAVQPGHRVGELGYLRPALSLDHVGQEPAAHPLPSPLRGHDAVQIPDVGQPGHRSYRGIPCDRFLRDDYPGPRPRRHHFRQAPPPPVQAGQRRCIGRPVWANLH